MPAILRAKEKKKKKKKSLDENTLENLLVLNLLRLHSMPSVVCP